MRYSSTYVSERRLVMVRVSDLWIGLSFLGAGGLAAFACGRLRLQEMRCPNGRVLRRVLRRLNTVALGD